MAAVTALNQQDGVTTTEEGQPKAARVVGVIQLERMRFHVHAAARSAVCLLTPPGHPGTGEPRSALTRKLEGGA